MQIGIFRERADGENRVAIAPPTVKKFKQKGFDILIEKDAGDRAGFSNQEYLDQGAKIVEPDQLLGSDLVIAINQLPPARLTQLKRGAWVAGLLESYKTDFTSYASGGINAIAMELVPRTSRAQSMDVLSSQANIAGYRAVVEAVAQYPRFFPMMMTSAGMARPAKVIVLGVGVAGLQAIATARRLGAQVEAFDIRPEVKEQILSLGAKFLDLKLGDTNGSAAGGYAKELSADAKAQQQAALTQQLKKFDVIITTANVPGRKAPLLVTEEAVLGLRHGSVIIDMAAPSGGNCALTQPGQVIEKSGVKVVGHLNYPAMVPADASLFYGNNVFNLIELLLAPVGQQGSASQGQQNLVVNFEDDILAATVVTYNGQIRWKPQG
ncbi:MAG: Re/Si-specific NAD(P)(+) transhydrogenase subunit alpha [Bdellovibrionales bacterium]|nr:Re/Si-specific NAD(P)(+) transhydrogenase subunit alpha [Bdellovibrionales bacterium]